MQICIPELCWHATYKHNNHVYSCSVHIVVLILAHEGMEVNIKLHKCGSIYGSDRGQGHSQVLVPKRMHLCRTMYGWRDASMGLCVDTWTDMKWYVCIYPRMYVRIVGSIDNWMNECSLANMFVTKVFIGCRRQLLVCAKLRRPQQRELKLVVLAVGSSLNTWTLVRWRFGCTWLGYPKFGSKQGPKRFPTM